MEPASDIPSASDTALRVFAYAGLILNLGATLSSVLLLLAITSVPTAARRIYMSCSHGYPRKVFLHHKNSEKEESEVTEEKQSGSPSGLTSGMPHFPRLQHRRPNVNNTMDDMKSLNQFLLQGDTEVKILQAFGVARGWHYLLQHCIFCFLAGCVCAFVHVGILVWDSESMTVASVMMPVALVGFIPPLIVLFFAMDSPRCRYCYEERLVCIVSLLLAVS